MLTLVALGVLLLAPAFALFFGGMLSRLQTLTLLAAGAVALPVSTAVWMLLGSSFAVALLQSALATAALVAMLATGVRFGRLRGYLVFGALWLLLVLIPVGFSVFDVEHGALVLAFGTLDFGGAGVLGLAVGEGALAVALVERLRGRLDSAAPRRDVATYLVSAGAGVLGILSLSVGAELVLDATTLTLVMNEFWAAGAGVVGWSVAQLVNVHRPTWAGAVAGMLAGSIAVLPASPWLDAVSVVLIGLTAGILGHVAAAASRRTGLGPWAVVIGVTLVPAIVGFVGSGILATGAGLVNSGHTELLSGQVLGMLAIIGYTLVVTLVLAVTVDRTLGLARRDAVDDAEGQHTGQ